MCDVVSYLRNHFFTECIYAGQVSSPQRQEVITAARGHRYRKVHKHVADFNAFLQPRLKRNMSESENTEGGISLHTYRVRKENDFWKRPVRPTYENKWK